MRTQYLMAFLLTAGIGLSQAPNKQTGNQSRGCTGCFSEPQSTLLFSPPDGDTKYGDYTLVAPSGNFTVLQLPGSVGHLVSPNWAISLSGDLVAGGLSFMLNADIVKCDPAKKGWCDPHPRPIFKSVMGVYTTNRPCD